MPSSSAVAVEHGDNPDDVQPANGQAPQHPPRPGQQPLRSEPHGDSREPAHHDLGDRQNLQPQQQQVPPPPPQQQHLNHQKQPHQAHQAQPPSKQRDGRADKPAPRESQPNRQSGQMRIHINVAIRAANACMSNTAEIEPNRLAVGLLRIRIQKLAAALHALLSAPGIDPHTPPSEAAVAAAAAAQPGGRRSWVSETAKAAAASAAVPSSIALPALEALAALLAQIARFLKRQASKTPLRQLLQHRTAAARVAMLDSQLLGLAEPLLIDLIVVDMSMRPSIQRDYDLLRDLMPLIAKAHIVQTQLVETLYDIDVVIQNQMADFPVHMHTGLWAALTSARSALATLAGRDLVPYKVWSVNPDDVEILFDQLIGHGSIGPIYKGLYNNLDVAIQMAPFVSSVEAAHTFAAEAEAWFLLRHPNVLGLWHFCVNVDLPFLVLPLLRSSISAHLRSQSKTDVAVRMGFIFGIAKGMRYLHGLPVPIVHGDLRASNVLLGYDGEVAITDVGMSLTKAHCKPSPGRQSSSIRWVAPERYRRGYKPAPPLDVFAFAMTCWEVITGRAPFFEEPEDEIVKDWIRDGERPPRVSIIPDTLWEVMQDCWQPDPEKRPTSTQILFRLSTTPISRPLVVDFPYVQPLQRALNEATGSNNAIAHTAAAIKHNTSSKNRALAAAFSKRMPTSITMASHTLCVPDTSVSRTKLLASERVKGMTIKPVAALQPPPEMVLEINPEATAALAPRLPASVVSAATTVSNVGRGPNRRPDRQGPTSSGYHSYDRTARGPRAAQYSQAKTADKLGRRAATAPSRRKTSTHVEPTESDSMPSDNEPPRKRMSLPAASKRSHNSMVSAEVATASPARQRRQTASLDAPSARKRASDTDRFLSIFSSISKRLKIRKDNFYKYSAVTTLAEWLAQVPSKRFRIGKNEKDNFTIIRLADGDVNGEIPEGIGEFTDLEWLQLSNNTMGGSIPRQIGKLSNLRGIQLHNLGLTGPIPSEIGKLTQLMELRMSKNKLTSLPPEIGNVTRLTYLELSANRISGLPPQICRLTELVKINLSQNPLNCPLPEDIGDLVSVREINMASCSLQGPLPTSLGKLVNLLKLDLRSNYISGPVPKEIAGLMDLTHLDLSLNNLEMPPPPEFRDMKLLVCYLNQRKVKPSELRGEGDKAAESEPKADGDDDAPQEAQGGERSDDGGDDDKSHAPEADVDADEGAEAAAEEDRAESAAEGGQDDDSPVVRSSSADSGAEDAGAGAGSDAAAEAADNALD